MPLTQEDLIELTIYSGINKVNVCNQADISDMAIAALTLLPALGTLLVSGASVTNLGLYVMTTSTTITKLDLSRYTLQLLSALHFFAAKGCFSKFFVVTCGSRSLTRCNNLSCPFWGWLFQHCESDNAVLHKRVPCQSARRNMTQGSRLHSVVLFPTCQVVFG